MKVAKKILLILELFIGLAAEIQAQDAKWKTLSKEAVSPYQQGQYEQATELVKKALEIAEKTLCLASIILAALTTIMMAG